MINKINNIFKYIKKDGFLKTLKIIYYVIFKNRYKTRIKLSYKFLKGEGIEIGSGNNPLKINSKNTKVKYVDYVDEKTLYEHFTNGNLKNLELKKLDYICKADNLFKIPENSQDFIIGNHIFEHLENPIKALLEWYRVLKNGGIIFMAIPDKRKTFDVNRERTSLEHIIEDYKNPSEERDWSHYIEYSSIWEKNQDKIENKAKYFKDNNYSIHYHVFLEEDVLKIIDWCNKNTNGNFEIIYVKSTYDMMDNEFVIILKVKK